MGISRRHHYVPQNLIRRFCRDDGLVYFAPTKGGAVHICSPRNVFLAKDINSFYTEDGMVIDTLEKNFYAKLDSSTKTMMDEIEAIVGAKKLPKMNQSTRATWDQIVYNLWKRSPEFHENPQIFEDQEGYIKNLIDERRQQGHFVDDEDEVRILVPEKVREIIQNARAINLARQSSKILGYLSEFAICWAVPRRTQKAFILGSNPVVSLRDRANRHLSNPRNETLLPVAPSICAIMTGRRGDEKILYLDDHQVRRINGHIAKQSRFIAGNSRQLIQSLVNPR